MTKYTLSIFFFLLLFGTSCDDDTPDPDPDPEVREVKVEYVESTEDFANPERGFYKYSETRASNYNPLSVNQLKRYRNNLDGGSGAQYKTYKTLVFRYYVLDEFADKPISQEYLDGVADDFTTAREAGVKLIPRFCYTTTSTSGSCNEGFICPPYKDAPKDIVLQHIEQVSPILNDNKDVILCIQMGWIGTWGENYYTDYFGDASSNGGVNKLSDKNWEDRIEVLKAMLDNLDKELMVQVRYVQMIQRYIYGVNSSTSDKPMDGTMAFDGSDFARLGLHNDCLFASADDFGTYSDYGNDANAANAALPKLKPFLKEQSKYVYIGGETCFDGWNPYNNCEPEGRAVQELRDLHYTYLNIDYNNKVNNDWVEGGCSDEIIQGLGYRYVMRNGTFETILSDDNVFNMNFTLENIGFSRIMKERDVYFILTEKATGEEHRYKLDTDIRDWVGEIKVETSIPLDLPVGEYSGYLFFPDGSESIADRPEYAIRLANESIWIEENGYNDLNFTVKVN